MEQGSRLSLIVKSGWNLKIWKACFGGGSVARSLLFRRRLYKTSRSLVELLLRGDNQLKSWVVVSKDAGRRKEERSLRGHDGIMFGFMYL